MKQIFKDGENTYWVTENTKDTLWYICWTLFRTIILWPLIIVIGFAVSCYGVYFLMEGLPRMLLGL